MHGAPLGRCEGGRGGPGGGAGQGGRGEGRRAGRTGGAGRRRKGAGSRAGGGPGTLHPQYQHPSPRPPTNRPLAPAPPSTKANTNPPAPPPGVVMTAYQENPRLKSFFKVLSLSLDRRGLAYISTMEAWDYPVWATQWWAGVARGWGWVGPRWRGQLVPTSSGLVAETLMAAAPLVCQLPRAACPPRPPPLRTGTRRRTSLVREARGRRAQHLGVCAPAPRPHARSRARRTTTDAATRRASRVPTARGARGAALAPGSHAATCHPCRPLAPAPPWRLSCCRTQPPHTHT